MIHIHHIYGSWGHRVHPLFRRFGRIACCATTLVRLWKVISNLTINVTFGSCTLL